MATDYGTEIAINAFLFSARDNENMVTYNNPFFWLANLKKIFLVVKV